MLVVDANIARPQPRTHLRNHRGLADVAAIAAVCMILGIFPGKPL
jgi:hypothetical protein